MPVPSARVALRAASAAPLFSASCLPCLFAAFVFGFYASAPVPLAARAFSCTTTRAVPFGYAGPQGAAATTPGTMATAALSLLAGAAVNPDPSPRAAAATAPATMATAALSPLP